MFRGEFSEADRVMVEGIFDHIQKVATKKIQKQAVGNDENQFVDSIFPDIFGKAAQNATLPKQMPIASSLRIRSFTRL